MTAELPYVSFGAVIEAVMVEVRLTFEISSSFGGASAMTTGTFSSTLGSSTFLVVALGWSCFATNTGCFDPTGFVWVEPFLRWFDLFAISA